MTVKLFEIKKVAEINVGNESGYPVQVDDRWAGKQLGVEMISSQLFSEDTIDFYPILTKAIAAKPYNSPRSRHPRERSYHYLSRLVNWVGKAP